MSNYRRPRIPGAKVFFTVNLAHRPSDLLVRHIDVLRQVVAHVRAAHPFAVDAWVVLPDHMHAIWTLPDDDADYSMRWSLIKAGFSRQMPMQARRRSHVARREKGVWQRRFWERHLRDEADYLAHLQYCRDNPVRHGLVGHPDDWPYASFSRAVRMDAHPT